jgi:hypothetical protein
VPSPEIGLDVAAGADTLTVELSRLVPLLLAIIEVESKSKDKAILNNKNMDNK